MPLPPKFAASLQDIFGLIKKNSKVSTERSFLFLRRHGGGNRYVHRVSFDDARPWFREMDLPRRSINLATRLRSDHVCTPDHFARMGWNIPLECSCREGKRFMIHLLNECPLLSPGRPRFFGFLNSRLGFSVRLTDLDEFIFEPDRNLVEELILFFGFVRLSTHDF